MEASINSARSLAARSVHIKIHPTARNLSERREVIRVLERFGEVSMFRSLKYSLRSPVPNAFLSIFNTEASATEAINSSPIRYRLIIEHTPPSPPISEFPEYVAPAQNKEVDGVSSDEEERVFELHISRSSFNHNTYLHSPITNPLHGPFTPVKPAHSYIAAALERLVPDSVASRGLRDWDTDSPRGRSGKVLGPEVEISDAGTGEGVTVEQRVKQRERRRREKGVPRVMKGLKALREEWEERQTRKEEGVD